MLNELAKKCFENSKAKGFWDHENKIIEDICNSRQTNGTSTFSQQDIDRVKTLFRADRLMQIVSELGEMTEAMRTGKNARLNSYQKDIRAKGKDFDEDSFTEYIKDTQEDELADALIRILSLCGGEGIDIAKHVGLKMQYNAGRKKLHGKKY